MSLLDKLTKEQLEEMFKIESELEPCKHCGRLVLCGPPCCQGMKDDIKAKENTEKAKLEEEKKIRRKAKQQRKLMRRAKRCSQRK